MYFLGGMYMSDRMKGERGAIMVEASIYFPIVIFTVFAMIYFGMVMFQDSILTFQVQKLATMGGREVAYPGYEAFSDDGSLFSTAVDFKAESNFSSKMSGYYEGHSEHLYNEWRFDYAGEEQRLERELSDMLSKHSFLTGVQSDCEVHIENYVLGKSISVEASYGLKSPKFLSYVGVPLDLKLKSSIRQTASNPTEMVRNIELSADLIDFLLERFGVTDQVDSFLKKVEDIKNKIL